MKIQNNLLINTIKRIKNKKMTKVFFTSVVEGPKVLVGG